MFDVQDFLQTSYTDVPPDRATPIPVGEYTAQVDTGDNGLKLSQGSKDGREWKRLDVRLLIADPSGALKETHGDKPTFTHGVMLDLDDNGRLDMSPNRNVRLGKLLEAAGVRKQGWKFTDLYGKAVKIKVVHEPDRNDPTIIRAQVAQVTTVSA